MRILLYLVIFAIIYFGIKKIVTDWRNRFREIDKKTRERDIKERKRNDIVNLKKDKDGVFRPDDKDKSD